MEYVYVFIVLPVCIGLLLAYDLFANRRLEHKARLREARNVGFTVALASGRHNEPSNPYQYGSDLAIEYSVGYRIGWAKSVREQ